MRATAGDGDDSKVVDLYDSGTGLWSTAQLSQARSYVSATSVGAVAIFAGGLHSKLLMIVFVCCLREFRLRLQDVLWKHLCLCLGMPCGSDCFLMRAIADVYMSKVVDLYDSGTGRWSTAQLSQARCELSATSIGAVAIFAGGGVSKLLMIVFACCARECSLRLQDVLWEHLCLCLGMPCGSDCFLMRATAGFNDRSNVVDLYDSRTKQWSTAQLSQARSQLSATSVGAVAIFAGGSVGSKLHIVLFVCCLRKC